MIIKCIEFPNREFATKCELHRALKKNKATLIDMKKTVKYSIPLKSVFKNQEGETVKGITIDKGSSLHVINTTKILDSHNDLHIDGIWNQSVKDEQGKIYFLADHDLGIGSVIAYPKDVNMSVKDFVWKDLGFDFEGNTQALVFKIDNDNIRHKEVRHIIETKQDIQHSVRMAYIKIDLAINSDDSDFKEEKIIWDKFIPEVANKEVADELSFMWVVSEAKIHREGSMVLLGSNHATPMINAKIEIEEKNIESDNSFYYGLFV